VRYLRRGRSKVYVVAALPDEGAPTVAQIVGGTDITAEILNLSGWTMRTAGLRLVGHSSPFVPTIRGTSEPANPTPTITFFDDDDESVVPVRTLLAAGSAGFLVMCPTRAPVVGDLVEVWPVESHGPANEWEVGLTAASWDVAFSITSRPTTNAIVTA
jgi:hypothetical protein